MSAAAVAPKPFLAPIGGNFPRPLSSPYRMPLWHAVGVPIWKALGLTKQYWQQSLENAQFFSVRHLQTLDEIDGRRLDAALRKAWGDDYDENERAARWFLNDSGKQFFEARDEDGHAFKNMPVLWETALAASQQKRSVDPVRQVHRILHPEDAQ